MKSMILEAQNISKIFPGVIALNDVSLGLSVGEVHCLVGENGAGKSTLIKIFAGQYPQDMGNILIDGKEVHFTNPANARDQGISVIHQELQLVPFISVAENIALGHWPSNLGFVKRKRLNDWSYSIIKKLGLDIDVRKKVIELSTAQQQLVEIAKALSIDSTILIMDEPTASLSESETKTLFEIIANLRESGLAILYVSHRLEEVFEIADKVSVLRDGKLVGTSVASDLTPDDVIKMMVGKNVSLFSEKKHKPGKKIIEVNGLTRYGVVEDVSFDIHEGEIVGLAGLMGAGRTEVARCLFGIDPIDVGEIKIDGKPVKIDSPRKAMDYGIGFVPEDRKTQGLVLVLSLKNNITISSLDKLNNFGWMRTRDELTLVEDYREKLQIKSSSVNATATSLSGGNQQKVVIARWLATKPRIMILDEPTRGVDVGAKAEIHRIIEQLVESGLGILLISSELPELQEMSDRIFVMRDGRIVKELQGAHATKNEIMKYAAGSVLNASGHA